MPYVWINAEQLDTIEEWVKKIERRPFVARNERTDYQRSRDRSPEEKERQRMSERTDHERKKATEAQRLRTLLEDCGRSPKEHEEVKPGRHTGFE